MPITTEEKVRTSCALRVVSCNYRAVSDIDWKKVFPSPPCRILSAVWFLRRFLHAQSVSNHPQHLKRIKIQALTRPFQSLVDLLECFGSLSCCIVHIRGHQFQFLDRWSHIFLKHPQNPLWSLYHLNYGELARPCCSRAAPNHDISSPTLHSWNEVVVLTCFLCFAPNMSSVIVPR